MQLGAARPRSSKPQEVPIVQLGARLIPWGGSGSAVAAWKDEGAEHAASEQPLGQLGEKALDGAELGGTGGLRRKAEIGVK